MHVGCCSVACHNSPGLLSSSQLLSKSGRSCSPPPDRSLVEPGAPECAQAGKENASAFWLTRTALVLTGSLKFAILNFEVCKFEFSSEDGLGGAWGTGRTTMLSAHRCEQGAASRNRAAGTDFRVHVDGGMSASGSLHPGDGASLGALFH